MTWDELLDATAFNNVEVEIINPTRKEDCYKRGSLKGFKAGIWGGGHKRFVKGVPHSFCSSDTHWIKKPKVLVAYNIFTFGHRGKQHNEWIDIDNCTFSFKAK